VSEYAKLSLAAASDACRHASFESSEGPTCSAILGTMHGSPAYCEQYYRQIVDEGMAAANPVLFAEGVPNAAAAHLSMGLGLRGGCQTLIGTRTAGLEALILAGMRVREGRISRCVVVAAEEYSEVANLAHASCGTRTAREASAGAVSFLVESRAFAESRGARLLANLGRFGWGTGAADTADLWHGILGKPPVTWVDIPGVPLAEYVGAADRLRSVSELFPEMYSVSSLVAVAAILAEAVGPAAVVSGDASERVCGMGLSVCEPSTGSG
jgi:3-oxoacyl-[acyl-carrier-protein] synthase II